MTPEEINGWSDAELINNTQALLPHGWRVVPDEEAALPEVVVYDQDGNEQHQEMSYDIRIAWLSVYGWLSVRGMTAAPAWTRRSQRELHPVHGVSVSNEIIPDLDPQEISTFIDRLNNSHRR